MRRILVSTMALGLLASPAAAQTIGAGGGSSISSWGKPDTQTYGQTVTAVNTSLDSFSFWLGGGSSLQFQAHVFAWDNTNRRATGSSLFSSAVMSAPGGAGFQQVSIATGGVTVNISSMYVLFLSTSGLAGSGQIAWEANQGSAYDDGAFVFINNGDNTSLWTSGTWTTDWNAVGQDLRFEATFSDGGFSEVPEPLSMVLMGTGLMGVGMLRRRRRLAIVED